jgi:predicted enzyme related to lactoylglutathione lyase
MNEKNRSAVAKRMMPRYSYDRIRALSKGRIMPPKRLLIYAKNVEETARFYEKHFGFKAIGLPGDRIVELVSQDGGANIMLHQAAKGQRSGQSTVKLVFDVEDVVAFCRRCAENGLEFGAIHKADGYMFANAKDPCQNSISVSSRAFRKRAESA